MTEGKAVALVSDLGSKPLPEIETAEMDKKVVQLPARRPRQEAQPEKDDSFLITEGLDVIAAYRSIADVKLRHALKHVIFAVAEAAARNRL